MNRFTRRSSLVYLLWIVCLLAPLLTLAQSDSNPPAGVLWEVTSQPTMEGMPGFIPAQTLKVCAKADATEPPGSANDERGCVNSSFQRDNDTVTWTSVCTGPPAMTGSGEIVFESEDAYSGVLRYAMAEGTMVIALSGKRIDTCTNPR